LDRWNLSLVVVIILSLLDSTTILPVLPMLAWIILQSCSSITFELVKHSWFPLIG
ncbi:hypothetical protein PTTG_30765, partial [Puccinia triticina 1-1 BBBD Race 1]